MPLTSKPTRIYKTEQSYRRRTRNLVAQCRKSLHIPQHEALDYRRFVGWLVTQKPNWSRDTWRQYKASVVFFLEQEAAKGDEIALEAMEFLLPVDVQGCVKKTKKTSGTKQKKVPLKDYKAIIQNLHDFGSPWADDLERWIGASLLTGLRPIEWATSRVVTLGGEEALIVDNAKNTNGRAHGQTRTIMLGGLSSDERDMIKAHVNRAREWEMAQQYSKFYQGCAATLSKAVRRLWPQRKSYVTLYSMRHQFSANAKASGFTREEIAALMGHAVDRTATEHYGRKSAGYEMIRVRPDPKEVAKIRTVFKNRFKAPKPVIKNIPVLKPSSEESSN